MQHGVHLGGITPEVVPADRPAAASLTCTLLLSAWHGQAGPSASETGLGDTVLIGIPESTAYTLTDLTFSCPRLQQMRPKVLVRTKQRHMRWCKQPHMISMHTGQLVNLALPCDSKAHNSLTLSWLAHFLSALALLCCTEPFNADADSATWESRVCNICATLAQPAGT